eukprot:GEZU01023276.1.p2 GENE.GEZU01023276.1~~GEZU01023276.1.p2  ORF type:complete len:128 (-),score=4.52 GEZU01023276.1:578-961(-)
MLMCLLVQSTIPTHPIKSINQLINTYSFSHVGDRIAIHHGEAQEEHVRARVAQRPELVELFLARRVPQPEIDRLPVDHHIRTVVLENGWNVILFISSNMYVCMYDYYFVCIDVVLVDWFELELVHFT